MKYPFNVRASIGEDHNKEKFVVLWAEHGEAPLRGGGENATHLAYCGTMFCLPKVNDVEQAKMLKEGLAKCIDVLNDFIGEE